MVDFGLSLAVIFGGVFGGAIGFVLIAATAVLLTLPYLMMNRPLKGREEEDRAFSDRY